ncbi:MAG: hypothetical protein ICV83_27220, partial [Cytophagales bacterium]|nr:hypothetical protein [Cytophagales bacterium]
DGSPCARTLRAAARNWDRKDAQEHDLMEKPLRPELGRNRAGKLHPDDGTVHHEPAYPLVPISPF